MDCSICSSVGYATAAAPGGGAEDAEGPVHGGAGRVPLADDPAQGAADEQDAEEAVPGVAEGVQHVDVPVQVEAVVMVASGVYWYSAASGLLVAVAGHVALGRRTGCGGGGV